MPRKKQTVCKFEDRNKYNEYGSKIGKRNNEQINATGCDFRMIVGRRSNGKTYPTLVFDGIKQWIDTDGEEAFAYVRRWGDDLKDNAPQLFNGCISDGWLSWYSKGKWNNITYYRRCWYLVKLDPQTGEVKEKAKKPLAYAFALNLAERYKGPDYPMVKRIIFDEFIPEKKTQGYIPGEWKLWKSLLSTIIRERTDVIVYMIANTISKACPYFDAYHIDIDEVEAGTLATYKYSGGGTLALEYCKDSGDTTVASSKYFEIDDDNGTGSMITKGEWETDLYPELPRRLSHVNRTVFKFFIKTGRNKVIQGNIIETNGPACVFFHMKTTPLQYRSTDYVYQEIWDADLLDNPLIRIGFSRTRGVDKLILDMVANNRAFYSNNDVGDKVKAFINMNSR